MHCYIKRSMKVKLLKKKETKKRKHTVILLVSDGIENHFHISFKFWKLPRTYPC